MPARRVALALAAAAAGFGGVAPAAPSAAQVQPGPGDGPEVVELRFEGARSFFRAELAAAIMTEQTQCPNLLYEVVCWAGIGQERAYLPPGALEADVLRLRVYYYERGFREATVRADTVRAGRGVRLVFHIEEGPPIRVAEVEVADAPAGLTDQPLPLRVGDPFDMVAYEAGRDTLLARLRNTGYARAQVLVGYSIASAAPYEAAVRYEVIADRPMRFGEVRVSGNEQVSDQVIERMLTFRPGGLYNRSALLESQRNLYRLQMFRHAEVRADLSEASDTVVPVTIQIAEGHLRRVRVGGGLNNVECGNVEGRWVARNFLGDGRRFEARAQLGNLLMDQCQQVPVLMTDYAPYDSLTGLVAVDFTQPWFFGPRNSVGVGLFGERRSVPEVFVRTAVGGHLTLGRSLGPATSISLSWRPEWARLGAAGDLFFCVSFVACTFEDTRVLREPHWLSPIAVSLSTDRTDVPFTPSRGYIARFDVEHAGAYTGSHFSYTRVVGEGSTYVGQVGGVILATRLRGGLVQAHGAAAGELGVNPQKRFFAGGPSSVRGFEQYRLGPSVLGIDAVPWLVQMDNAGTSRVDGAGCTPAEVNDGSCDVAALHHALFFQRPVGGEVMVEGNLELRFPLPVGSGRLRAGAFIDAGQVWASASNLSVRDIVATPGVGLRYFSPVGPIRLDAGFNTQGARMMNVLTTRVEECLLESAPGCRKVDGPANVTLRNTDDVVPLLQPIEFGSAMSGIGSWGDFFRRVTLHFSIGQAF